jgi:carbonic anhydrase
MAGDQVAASTRDSQAATTPDQALQMLKDGNERFVSGRMRERDLMSQVRQTASGQFPHAAVLGCIDSRVPPELVFDQGVGDIFCGRVAGNFVNTDLLGSFEFATKLSGAKLIVVLGHSACGAIKGACDNAQLGNLTQTLSNLLPALYSVVDADERSSRNTRFVEKVSEANVMLTVANMTERSPVISALVEAGELKVVGAMHDVASGRVRFYE